MRMLHMLCFKTLKDKMGDEKIREMTEVEGIEKFLQEQKFALDESCGENKQAKRTCKSTTFDFGRLKKRMAKEEMERGGGARCGGQRVKEDRCTRSHAMETLLLKLADLCLQERPAALSEYEGNETSLLSRTTKREIL